MEVMLLQLNVHTARYLSANRRAACENTMLAFKIRDMPLETLFSEESLEEKQIIPFKDDD